MIIRRDSDAICLVGQPAHAHLAGQLARAWNRAALPAIGAVHEDMVLGITLHDLAWARFETAPTLNPETGLPHSFREMRLAPALWAEAVHEARAFGRWPALMVSLQGSRVYGEFFRRDRASPADIAAVDAFLPAQQALQAEYAAGFNPDSVRQANALLGAVDWLSLLLCGDTVRASTIPACPLPDGQGSVTLSGDTLHPWPFGPDTLDLHADTTELPPGTRFSDRAALHTGLATARRGVLRWRLRRG
jgi:hypothetical protein